MDFILCSSMWRWFLSLLQVQAHTCHTHACTCIRTCSHTHTQLCAPHRAHACTYVSNTIEMYTYSLYIHIESDYRLSTSFGSIASLASVPAASFSITISILNDLVMEGNEEFIVRAIPRAGQFSGNLVFSRNFTTVTILNSTESKYFCMYFKSILEGSVYVII